MPVGSLNGVSNSKKLISIKRSSNLNQYEIEIASDSGNSDCKIVDVIEAVDAVDAYSKANEIASKLNDEISRDGAFYVACISRKN